LLENISGRKIDLKNNKLKGFLIRSPFFYNKSFCTQRGNTTRIALDGLLSKQSTKIRHPG
jgi:hypothetical protein